MVQIFFIYANDCEHCQEALSVIESSIKKCSEISCEIKKFHYDTKPAVAIAINKGINDLPGFVIGDDVYVGNNYTEEKIVKSIRKSYGR